MLDVRLTRLEKLIETLHEYIVYVERLEGA